MKDEQPVPMARLLAMSYRLLIDGLHIRLREAGWTDVRPAYGFVLLATRDRSTTSTELASLLGVSKQAVSKLIDAMEASGYVRRSPGTDDARVRSVELVDRGHQLLAAVESIYRDLESEWSTVIGERAVEQTRRNLSRVVLAAHDGVFPAIRIS
ncbi:MAG TPA: MarR family transcriptional regulator [Ilumatobacteraceae bacterium]|jgi:DNA-binding MarR family transcriptional regulator|nr:MarR family transcriptional regulator [Ilumatobacteraceae bacterium]